MENKHTLRNDRQWEMRDNEKTMLIYRQCGLVDNGQWQMIGNDGQCKMRDNGNGRQWGGMADSE